MEIYTLVENTCGNAELAGEFGLSLLINSNGRKIVFDMGASSRFIDNGKSLGENFQDIDFAVVSHAHYDHGGGLADFFQVNSGAKVYVGKGIEGDYYGNAGALLPPSILPFVKPLISRSKYFRRYIGIDKNVVQRNKARIEEVLDETQPLENIYLLGKIKARHPSPKGNGFLLERCEDELVPDRFEHELIMVIEEDDGLILFTGCGHSGILNMIERLKERFPGKKLKAVVGGFHLALQPQKVDSSIDPEEVERLADQLLQAGVEHVVTGHCTGREASIILRKRLQDRFSSLTTGSKHII